MGESRASDWIEGGLRLAGLVGLGVSALLWAEYLGPKHALCGADGGCDAVRLSRYSSFAGVPLPIVGFAYFALALLVSVVPGWRWTLRPLAASGGAVALVLLAIQAFVLETFCRLCVMVDLSALALGLLALGNRPAPPARWAGPLPQAATAALVVAAGMVWYASLSPQPAANGEAMPELVRREQRGDGVTVVEFVDFQCPACRAQHAVFHQVLPRFAGRVHMVVKHLPLKQHEHAVDAARAFCCAEEHGQSAAMADRLFRAEGLTPADCEEIAVSLGLDRDRFRACIADERTAARLDRDRAAAAEIGVRGLPTFWIGAQRFEGVHDDQTLRSSLERALQRADAS